MALTKGVTRKVEIPHEPDQWMELRHLSYRQLDEARQAKLDELFGFLRKTKDLTLPKPDDDKAAADRLAAYDVPTLLRHGIVAWSYGDAVTPDDLDAKTADWAAREILALSMPDEAAVGKGSSRSTGTSSEPETPPRSGA